MNVLTLCLINKRKTTARVKGNTSYSKFKIHFTLIDCIYTKLNEARLFIRFLKAERVGAVLI